MKEKLNNALAAMFESTKALVGILKDIIVSKGDSGFVFGIFSRPEAIDLMPTPVTDPFATHRVEAVRIVGDEWEAKLEGGDDWYPLALDLGYDELYLSPEELGAFICKTIIG